MKKLRKSWTANRVIAITTPLILIAGLLVPHCDSAADKSSKCASDLLSDFSKVPEKMDVIAAATKDLLLADPTQSDDKTENLDNNLMDYERYIKSINNDVSKCKCAKDYKNSLEQIKQEIENIRKSLQSENAPHLDTLLAFSKGVAQDSSVGNNCCSLWNYFFYRQ